ncbi:MAG: histidine triad nucleotide-binding protein [Zetaproteobacteria bacterium]|nr:histidine triad nucleotide-binding protein [Zetaproteobacteria bacterium]
MSNCLFCRIATGEIPAQKVFEDETMLAFRDIHPKAPTHILLIPKQHIATLADADDPALLGNMMQRVRLIAENEGIAEAGYRVVINVKEGGGQEIFHLHIHLLGGKRLPF